MPEIDEPFTCPRCSMKSPTVKAHLEDIQDKCSFCSENLERMLEGVPKLSNPTADFPAGSIR